MKWDEDLRHHVFKEMTDPDVIKTQSSSLALRGTAVSAAENGDHTCDGDIQSFENIAENAGIELSERRRAQ